MRAHLLAPPEHHWECPSCGAQDVTREVKPHSRLHPCPALGGLTVPMLPAGTAARHVAREREDYIGDEMVQLDNRGRPVMAVNTQYADGRQDATVYAPTARAHVST